MSVKEKQEQKRHKPYRKQQNDRRKSNHINDYIQCEWIKYFYQKAEIVQLDKNKQTNKIKNPRLNYILFIGDTLKI